MRTTSQGSGSLGASGNGMKTLGPSMAVTSGMGDGFVRVVFGDTMTFGFRRVTDQNAETFGTEQAGAAIEGGVLQFKAG